MCLELLISWEQLIISIVKIFQEPMLMDEFSKYKHDPL